MTVGQKPDDANEKKIRDNYRIKICLGVAVPSRLLCCVSPLTFIAGTAT